MHEHEHLVGQHLINRRLDHADKVSALLSLGQKILKCIL